MSKRSKYSLGHLSNSQIAYYIDEWIHDEEYRKILKRIYIDGKSNECVAGEYGYSVNTIKNIVRLSVPYLYEHIQGQDY